MKLSNYTAPELTLRSLTNTAYIAAIIERVKSVAYPVLYMEVQNLVTPKEFDRSLGVLKRTKMIEEDKNFTFHWVEQENPVC